MPDKDIVYTAKWLADEALYEIAQKATEDENGFLWYKGDDENRQVIIQCKEGNKVDVVSTIDNLPEGVSDKISVLEDRIIISEEGKYDFGVKFILTNGMKTETKKFTFGLDITAPTSNDISRESISWKEKPKDENDKNYDLVVDNITDCLSGVVPQIEVNYKDDNENLHIIKQYTI